MSAKDTFTDGLWHTVDAVIKSGTSDKSGLVSFTVDGVSDAANRQLSFTTLSTIYLGGRTACTLRGSLSESSRTV